MALSPKSRVVPHGAAAARRGEVRSARTASSLGSSRDPGTGAAVAVARRAALVVAIAAALLAGCDPRVRGSGILIDEPRRADGFVGLRVQDGIAGFVTVGPAHSVRVIADSNVVGNIDTSVEPAPLGSATVSVLFVRVGHSIDPVIPPTVVVTVPSFLLADASGGASIQLKATAGADPGPLLTVRLSAASLDAIGAEPDYVTSGAAVTLAGRSAAKLHSDGPVTGSVSTQSTLDNLQGTGSCDGVLGAPGAHVSCL